MRTILNTMLLNLYLLMSPRLIICSSIPPYFNIAVLVPVDENRLSYFSRFLPAILMAIDDINNKTNGVLDDLLPDSELRAVVRLSDDQFYNGANHARSSMKVDSAGVVAALGPPAFSIMKGASPVFEQFGSIPVFSYGERSSIFGNSELYPNLLRTIPPDYYDGFVLASVIRHYFRWNEVSVFSASTDLGRGCALLFRHYAALYGIKILSSHSLDAGDEDYSNEIRRAKRVGARIIVLFVEGDVAVRLIEQGSRVNFRNSIQVLSGAGLSSEYWESNNMRVSDYVGLTGFIGVKLHYYAPSSDLKNHFLDKWMNQQDSVGNASDPSYCDPSKDYYNDSHLYQYYPDYNMSQTPICTGVRFSQYRTDPTLLDDLNDVMYAYDSVLAIAHGLHDLIYKRSVLNPSPLELYSYVLKNISFVGLTGEVSYSIELKSDDYNVGGRRTAVVYDIFNFVPDLASNDIKSSFPVITTWHSELGVSPCNNVSYYVNGNPCNRFIFNTGDSVIINDSADPTYRELLPMYDLVILKVFASLGFSVAAVCMLITFVYRKRRLVKMSQPILTYITLFGIMLSLVRVFLSTHVLTDSICVAKLWFEHVPFQIIFGAVLIRAWRVYNITASLKRKKITDVTCCLYLVIWMSPMLLLLFLATLDGRIHVNYTTVIHNQYDFILEPSCTYHHTGKIETLMFVYDAFTIVVGLWWCWKIRNVRSTICNTPMLVQSFVTALVVIVTTLVISSIFPMTPLSLSLIVNVAILCLVFRLLYLFEAEIIRQLLTGYELDQGLMIRQTEKSIHDYLSLRSTRVTSVQVSPHGSSDPVSPHHMKYSNHRSKEELDMEINRLKDDIKGKQEELAYVENMMFIISESSNSSRYQPDNDPPAGVPTPPV